MQIDPDTLSRRDAYHLLLSIIIPRPIAFVTTISPEGVVNLAPFSFYSGVSSKPPIVMIAVGPRGEERKDTARNILETGEFVVNASTYALREAVNAAAGDWPAETSEVEVTGLSTGPSAVVRPPRLVESPVSMECVLAKAVELDGVATTAFFGRVLRYHIDDAVLGPDGVVDPAKLDPLLRLSGDRYARLGELFTMTRPRIDRATGERLG